MKKLLSIMLAIIITLSLCTCAYAVDDEAEKDIEDLAGHVRAVLLLPAEIMTLITGLGLHNLENIFCSDSLLSVFTEAIPASLLSGSVMIFIVLLAVLNSPFVVLGDVGELIWDSAKELNPSLSYSLSFSLSYLRQKLKH